jgi:hypothetical protein
MKLTGFFFGVRAMKAIMWAMVIFGLGLMVYGLIMQKRKK